MADEPAVKRRPRSASLARPPAFGDNAPMLPEADFTDAHRRHWEDAELLLAHDRWANADHLYGLSAECGLKAVMLSLGMNVDASGTPSERRHKEHMPRLWPVFEDFAREHGGGTYLASLSDGESFADWSIDDRYANHRHFQRANVTPHQDAARQVADVVQRVELERMT